MLHALEDVLTTQGALAGEAVPVAPPRVLTRSTVLFVGDSGAPEAGPRWVVKQRRSGAVQEDLDEPADAASQFASLALLERHLNATDEPVGVPHPVAVFPELDAFAMEHVPGTQVNRLLGPGALLHGEDAVTAVTMSGRLLSRIHDLRRQRDRRVDLRADADRILRLLEHGTPRPVRTPPRLRRLLASMPRRPVSCPTVRLHGDFAPVNVILQPRGRVSAIDVDGERWGVPEQDLARYLTLLSTDRLFTAGAGLRAPERLRERLESALFEGYDGPRSPEAVLELERIDQLVRRWKVRSRRPIDSRVAGLRRRLLDRRFESLLEESARRLEAAL
jgi:aminoglycoside phosphotransferase (APT) family kinase protein